MNVFRLLLGLFRQCLSINSATAMDAFRLLLPRKRRRVLDDIVLKAEARIGKIPSLERYHTQRKLEDDFSMSQSVLGNGCNGEVKMAISKSQPGHKVAVKSFQLDKLDNDERQMLENEVLTYLCVDHPQITTLYNVYESQHELHLVMECMEGGELLDRVNEKRFSEEEARNALRQMLLAMHYIHSHGIVHRDIKLENFVYDEKGSNHLKLLDFGFSMMWNANDAKMTLACGTLSYIAPEVFSQSYTSQCDLWSLGVSAFILLLGYMPFSGSNEIQKRNIINGKYLVKPKVWVTISDEAKSFLSALLEVDPTKRLTAEQALEHPWMRKSQTCIPAEVLIDVVEALNRFSRASIFHHRCVKMLAL